MNDAGTQTILQRFAASLVNRLSRHVTWHGGTDHNLADEAGRHFPLVLILGREHYKERRRTYPALRRRDLAKVLRQELAGEPPTLTSSKSISAAALVSRESSIATDRCKSP